MHCSRISFKVCKLRITVLEMKVPSAVFVARYTKKRHLVNNKYNIFSSGVGPVTPICMMSHGMMLGDLWSGAHHKYLVVLTLD